MEKQVRVSGKIQPPVRKYGHGFWPLWLGCGQYGGVVAAAAALARLHCAVRGCGNPKRRGGWLFVGWVAALGTGIAGSRDG